MTSSVPLNRRRFRPVALRPEGDYVLYWMVAQRRLRSNFALDRALELAREFGKPLLIFEPIRIGYRWASDRFHRFLLDGMGEHQERLAGSPVGYFPYVEDSPGAGSGLLEALAERAVGVVTDDFPSFFLRRMVEAAGHRLEHHLGCRLELIDSNGLLPLAAPGRSFARAYDFRRYFQKHLREHLLVAPQTDPLSDLAGLAPFTDQLDGLQGQWPMATGRWLGEKPADLGSLSIDHLVEPVSSPGGEAAARQALERFLITRLGRYGEDRSHPDEGIESELSPYLHFGHISAHEVFREVARQGDWNPGRLSDSTSGKRQGWWGMPANHEAFLDQLVTWRELGFVFAHFEQDHDQYDSLPDWARRSLDEHRSDPRPWLYSLEQFENADTHDELWNAAQRQLRREGRIHNYLRMLWGKKILHWSESPEQALEFMIELNNRWALDGRDPNSYSGIFWCLGRFDRAWGPEREVFGKIRYMTSKSARSKLRLRRYLDRYSC